MPLADVDEFFLKLAKKISTTLLQSVGPSVNRATRAIDAQKLAKFHAAGSCGRTFMIMLAHSKRSATA
jgi:hypothetical protein